MTLLDQALDLLDELAADAGEAKDRKDDAMTFEERRRAYVEIERVLEQVAAARGFVDRVRCGIIRDDAPPARGAETGRPAR